MLWGLCCSSPGGIIGIGAVTSSPGGDLIITWPTPSASSMGAHVLFSGGGTSRETSTAPVLIQRDLSHQFGNSWVGGNLLAQHLSWHGWAQLLRRAAPEPCSYCHIDDAIVAHQDKFLAMSSSTKNIDPLSLCPLFGLVRGRACSPVNSCTAVLLHCCQWIACRHLERHIRPVTGGHLEPLPRSQRPKWLE